VAHLVAVLEGLPARSPEVGEVVRRTQAFLRTREREAAEWARARHQEARAGLEDLTRSLGERTRDIRARVQDNLGPAALRQRATSLVDQRLASVGLMRRARHDEILAAARQAAPRPGRARGTVPRRPVSRASVE
jgi:hypothetical protein